MTESVSDILAARAHEIDGFGRPIMVSFAVHMGIVVSLAVLPAAWFAAKAPLKTITISLGAGALGPERTGMTATGGRKVDQVAEPAKREPILPVAPPKAAVPDPTAPTIKTPARTTDKPAPPPPILPTTKPAVGAKLAQGNALVETGAKGLGAGLSSGGLGGLQADVDFCCRDYLNEMMNRIAAVWQDKQGITGDVVVDFVIEKDGSITSIQPSKRSGYDLLDLAAVRAVSSIRLSPLPDNYTGQRMFISLRFPYNR